MTATAEPPASTLDALPQAHLSRGEGVELLGPVRGSGYKEGAALVRRADGQMVQLGPLMYGLLECADGSRDTDELAGALSERLGRRVEEEHVRALSEKLAEQGLLAGTEAMAPPKRNPLLALRWKVLITDPVLTRRITAPFTFLFKPWLMWPILAAFAVVFWFVLIHKGVASATAQAFNRPGLLLLVFALAVLSAGIHEIGHAAACRYGGATPGGMGVGLYLVWPAFYTDVTDAYRLPKRSRLRVDLGGLYFNAVVGVLTLAVWRAIHVDALLLVVALQVLQMVKQLSPVIRADGYHILSDATGVPDLYSHMGPTMRRLLPGHRHEPSALTGKARLLVTLWVLIIVPVLLSLSLSAVLLLPKLATTAWDSGRHIVDAIPHEASSGDILNLLASIVRLLALALPVAGSVLVTQRIVRTTVGKARAWSQGHPPRQVLVSVVAAIIIASLAWAWWPSGQYQPVRAHQNGTLGGLIQLVSAPAAVARPSVTPAPVSVAPGTHLAVAMVPVGGASKKHPALFLIPGKKGSRPVAILSSSSPNPSGAPTAAAGTSAPSTTSDGSGTSSQGSSSTPASPTQATAFPFTLPAKPGPNDSQALAVNQKDGGVTYDVTYSLVTVKGGAPVTETNSAFALANCNACTTVAVSFQVVLVVGQSNNIAPINAAGALNYHCPACVTTALADQLVVTLTKAPSKQLLDQLTAALKQLNALPSLGAGGTPAAIAAAVNTVEQQIDTELNQSGLLAHPITSTSTTGSQTTPSGSSSSASPSGATSTTGATAQTSSTATSPPTTSTPTTSTPTTTTAASSTAAPSNATTAPAGTSTTP